MCAASQASSEPAVSRIEVAESESFFLSQQGPFARFPERCGVDDPVA